MARRRRRNPPRRKNDSFLTYLIIGGIVYFLFTKSAFAGTVSGHNFRLAADQQTVTDLSNGTIYTIANDSGFTIGASPQWSLSADGSVLTEANTQNVYTFQG